MRIAVILFHKNLYSIYKERWITDSVNSVLNQTFQDFDILEINYGEDSFSLSSRFDFSKKNYVFYNTPLKNHAEAQNFLLDRCREFEYDYVFNTNLDDINTPTRFEDQLRYAQENNTDVTSGDMFYIRESPLYGVDEIFDDKNLRDFNTIEKIHFQFKKGINVVCHPLVLYSSKFIREVRYNPEEIPQEDFLLWKRLIHTYTFGIVPKVLLHYRIHQNQISYKS